jgi:predicted nucleic acid-binding protein
MAAEVFIDTSGFYAQWDRNDPAHRRAKTWMKANRGKFIAVTTAWVVGELGTLLMARGVPHLIGPFLDYLTRHESSPMNSSAARLRSTAVPS